MTSHPSSISTYGPPRVAVGRLEALPTTASTLNSLLLRHVRSQREGPSRNYLFLGLCSWLWSSHQWRHSNQLVFKGRILGGIDSHNSSFITESRGNGASGLFCKVEPFQSTTKQKSSWRMYSKTDRQSCNNLTEKEGKVKKKQTGWRAFFQETPFG